MSDSSNVTRNSSRGSSWRRRPRAFRTRSATRPSGRCSISWRPASAAPPIRPSKCCCTRCPLPRRAQATIIGRKERADALNATFLNAAGANVDEFCDTHLPTVIHPTAPVMPALYAMSELQRVRGADLLDAFALGVEVECRIGNSISPSHYRTRGWHITASCGVFGAAAAAGRLLGLDVAADGLGVRRRGDASLRPGGNARHADQEPRRRQCGAQRLVVGAAGASRASKVRRVRWRAGSASSTRWARRRNCRRCSTGSATPGSWRSTPTSPIPAAW